MQRLLGMAVLLGMGAGAALGQGAGVPPAGPAKMTRTQRADLQQDAPIHIFYLKHCAQPNDGNELLTGLRLMLDPSVKIYLVPSKNAIVLRALPDDLALATQMVAALDTERPSYKLTYVLTEFDGGKKVSTMRYAMTMVDGQRDTMQQGTRVPVTIDKEANYRSVGMSFDATLSAVEGGVVMRSRVEESSLAEDKGMVAGANPVIKQATVDGVYHAAFGKAQLLGSLEVPGTTRRMEVEALVERGN